MPVLQHLMAEARPTAHDGRFARATASSRQWEQAIGHLAAGELTLLGLWAEPETVYMALLDETAGIAAVLSLDCPDRTFPSVARLHPPAMRLERAVRDLFGLEPLGLPDLRPWLDHGRWGVRAPLARAPLQAINPEPEAASYPFLPVEGANLHQIPVGPVHAGIIEPGHFRFTAAGETVVRLEERLGYVHKGVEGLMAGADVDRGAMLAGRVSGDSTVAYAFAFSRAIEVALGLEPPPRAVWGRALMAEMERLANHLGDIGAICNDASFALMQAHCSVLRERVLRAADHAFGHRLMRDCIVPGGLSVELAPGGATAIGAMADEIAKTFPRLVDLYDNTTSLQDRTVSTGFARPELVRQFGAGGFVGRASGRAFDARKVLAYPPYDRLGFDVPVLTEGDVNARVWIRIREIEQSLALVGRILDELPDGPVRGALPDGVGTREGMAIVEGFRGDVLVWVRLAGPRIERCHLRDPSWFQWPLLEAAIENNIVADFPLCNKSFNCSYSGHDL